MIGNIEPRFGPIVVHSYGRGERRTGNHRSGMTLRNERCIVYLRTASGCNGITHRATVVIFGDQIWMNVITRASGRFHFAMPVQESDGVAVVGATAVRRPTGGHAPGDQI